MAAEENRKRRRYTHYFDLTFAVESDDPEDATPDEMWAAFNERVAWLRRNPESLPGEVGMPSDTHENERE